MKTNRKNEWTISPHPRPNVQRVCRLSPTGLHGMGPGGVRARGRYVGRVSGIEGDEPGPEVRGHRASGGDRLNFFCRFGASGPVATKGPGAVAVRKFFENLKIRARMVWMSGRGGA
jgi:hypothetical protein